MPEKKTKKSQQKIQQYEYQAELKQLLHLIVHSLYTHPEVFLRELISNASDALNKVRFRMLTDKNVLDKDANQEIKITIDSKENTFSIEDTGIGMTHDDLVKRIGTVASSGTMEFLEQLKKGKDKLDAHLIGQFGVGFYSVFMVTNEVTIETRHADPDSKGYRWKSDGQGTFTIEEIEKPNRGSKIYFKLNDDFKEFAEEYRVKNIINKYSNFVDSPILLNNERINKVEALWHKPKSEVKEEELNEFYKFVSNDFENPMGHLHLFIEGAVNFKALIFIPSSLPPHYFRHEDMKSPHLYSNKIFIQDDCKELLPEYLRFIKGVVDTEDLSLNVSREVTQSSPVMAKIRNTLVSKILGFLEDWAKNEPEKYENFQKECGPVFKLGLNSDFTNREKLIELLRFESTTTEKGKLTSLKNYVSRMGSEQKEIYYLAGESRDALERSPNLEYFKKKDIEVLLLTDPVDVFIIPSITEYDKKPVKSIDKADIDVSKDDDGKVERLNENLSKSLIDVFKETLGDKVEDIVESRRLVDSPATLVVGKEGMDAQMEKMMKMIQKDFTGSKRILEINTAHPLIKNLSRLNMKSSTDALLRQSILQIYEATLLLEDNLSSPIEFVKRMNDLMVEATKG
jgi:molecular chaperone HtpG